MNEMQRKTDLELVEAMRQLISATGMKMAAPDRATRILDEQEKRARELERWKRDNG